MQKFSLIVSFDFFKPVFVPPVAAYPEMPGSSLVESTLQSASDLNSKKACLPTQHGSREFSKFPIAASAPESQQFWLLKRHSAQVISLVLSSVWKAEYLRVGKY
jgi:hypothetical protein